MDGMRRGAIFDLDGTLADTSADLLGGANAALEAAGRGRPLAHPGDAGLSGRGGRAMLREGLARTGGGTEAEVEALFPPFIAAYEARIAEATRLFAGVEACFDALEAEGWILAVCTNKPERLARALLAELGIASRFAAILGADTLPVRKPDPEHLFETVRRAGASAAVSVMIGDTATDRETARAAEMPCVLMDFGLSADDAHALAPEAVARDFHGLAAVLERLSPRVS